MKRLSPIVVAALALLLAACAEEQAPSPLTVNSEGNTYHNAMFALTVEKPQGWYAQSPKETIALQQRGTAALAGDNENMQALIEASLDSTVPLFGFFEVAPGTPDRLNPNVLGMAENLTAFPGVQSGCDYLQNVRSLLKQGKVAYSFSEGCDVVTQGGRELGRITGRVKLGEVSVTQHYYATIQRPYALAFVQTFFSETDEASTGSVIESLRFGTE